MLGGHGDAGGGGSLLKVSPATIKGGVKVGL